jgi:hypothetical protein
VACRRIGHDARSGSVTRRALFSIDPVKGGIIWVSAVGSLSSSNASIASRLYSIALISAPALLFVLGMVTLLAGLAVVLAHNVWTGGLTPVLVSVVG